MNKTRIGSKVEMFKQQPLILEKQNYDMIMGMKNPISIEGKVEKVFPRKKISEGPTAKPWVFLKVGTEAPDWGDRRV